MLTPLGLTIVNVLVVNIAQRSMPEPTYLKQLSTLFRINNIHKMYLPASYFFILKSPHTCMCIAGWWMSANARKVNINVLDWYL